MNTKEAVINSNIFGGYNKKQTEQYIKELQKMIEELRVEQKELLIENEQMDEKLVEAEKTYTRLWNAYNEKDVLLEELRSQVVALKQEKTTLCAQNQNTSLYSVGESEISDAPEENDNINKRKKDSNKKYRKGEIKRMRKVRKILRTKKKKAVSKAIKYLNQQIAKSEQLTLK